ncbi:efflux transporter outer membrane subunit (plasmid) [Ralstonia pseudosolanacearum]|uniref:Efflux transporter outer membrane subunit n=1 Tax=Ralstonia solanacearum TaxID=305 RepID=A0AA92K724_RALSL|nr:efflux transporter outer membrane subunit [Ralstonia pseudosolanacearum]QOK99596.1 efflux transporter outer membrane subunit [Ralstonia pseudosolanacearum]
MNALKQQQGGPARPGRWTPLALAAALFLAACSLAPTYEKPDVGTPTAFKEAAQGAQNAEAPLAAGEQGKWKTAEPSMPADGAWWKLFNDATLDSLEAQAGEASPTLAAAAARVSQARAIVQSNRAGLFPELDAGFGPTRQRASAASAGLPVGAQVQPQTYWRAQATVSYEADLFGRVRNSVNAADADAERVEALYRAARLALQADVAQTYFSLRTLDAEEALLARTVVGREEALKLVQRRFSTGDIGELDVARADAELATARSDRLDVARRRALLEHALATLLGKAPSGFTLGADPLQAANVRVPPGLPSALLERRPDVAAAERAMAAANARIGVVRAAFFPQLQLTGGFGFESHDLGDLLKWSSRTWLLGPLVGTALSLPIFDGGARSAGVKQARAAYEENVANYREAVLVAFREVEDNLSDLRLLADQSKVQDDAVRASSRAAQLSRTRYNAGSVNYLDVIDAERNMLSAQRVAVQLAGGRVNATVGLVKALGGGWGDLLPQQTTVSQR